jgi:hypothetical protein
MSTNINIIVDNGGLLDRVRQQQASSRQAKLNQETSTRLEAQATTARTTSLAKQGRDANGSLVTGSSFRQPLIDRRPAASRTALKNSFVLDFSTASGSATYVQNDVGGNTLGTIRSTGRVKYQNKIIGSKYSIVTQGAPPSSPRSLSIGRSGGPFNQPYVYCISPNIGSNTGISALYPLGYDDTYSADGNNFSPPLGSLISDPPPFVPPNFVPLFNSPHTIEADIFFPSSSSLPFSEVRLRYSLISNSILLNEKKLKEALDWFSSSSGRQVPLYSVELIIQRGEAFRNFFAGSSFYNDESLIAQFSDYLDAPLSDGFGWRRVAVSFASTGIKYFENSRLTYSKDVNLKSYFNLLPSALSGFTWVPSISVRVTGIDSDVSLLSGLSTIRYSDRTLGNTYTPARLS